MRIKRSEMAHATHQVTLGPTVPSSRVTFIRVAANGFELRSSRVVTLSHSLPLTPFNQVYRWWNLLFLNFSIHPSEVLLVSYSFEGESGVGRGQGDFLRGLRSDMAASRSEFKQSGFLTRPRGPPGSAESLLPSLEPSEPSCFSFILFKWHLEQFKILMLPTHVNPNQTKWLFCFQLWSTIYSSAIITLFSGHHPGMHLAIYFTCPILLMLLFLMKDDDSVDIVLWHRRNQLTGVGREDLRVVSTLLFSCVLSRQLGCKLFKSRNDSEIFLTLLPPSLSPCGYSTPVYSALDIL